MTEILPTQQKTSTYISKKKKFQNDPNDPDVILVPKEQLPTPVLEMEAQKIKKKINLTEEQRLKRQEQGKKLGEMSRQRALDRKALKERETQVLAELEQRRKEEESKKLQDEINQKIQDGKLVRVKVKPASTRKKAPSVTVTEQKTPSANESRVVIETETETDTDHEEERKKQRKKRKEAVRIVETLKTIDETIQKVNKGKYFDQLNASWL
jgi:hypothetical protein